MCNVSKYQSCILLFYRTYKVRKVIFLFRNSVRLTMIPFKPEYACDAYSGIDLYLNSEIFIHMDIAINSSSLIRQTYMVAKT